MTVAVRIPRQLYQALLSDLLARQVERPSYAQIVAWTCEDHPGAVLAELARGSVNNGRKPRGRRLAADSVPLTLRFLPEEFSALTRAIAAARGDHIKITSTAAVIAALRVAINVGLPHQPSQLADAPATRAASK